MQETAPQAQEQPLHYGALVPANDDDIIRNALNILTRRLRTPGALMSSPADTKAFLRLHIGALEHEVFSCLFMDTKNRLIDYSELFRGTLTHTSVYPREIVKVAINHNAAAVIFAHNHPSGEKEPSNADRLLTTTLKQALAMIDVRVLDHIIVAGTDTYSFAEHGDL